MKKVFFIFLILILTHCRVFAQWVRLNSDGSGPIITIGNVLVMLTEAGPYRSTDTGNTWLLSDSGIPSSVCSWRYLYSLEQNGYFTTDYCGFFYSSDSGKTWENHSSGLLTQSLFQPASIGNYLFMSGLSTGIWESDSKASVWNSAYDSDSRFHLNRDTNVLVFASDSNILFAGCQKGGIFRSVDTAKTWYPVLPLMDTAIYTLTTIGSYVFAGTQTTIGVHPIGLYRTSNWGNSWQLANNGIPMQRIAVLKSFGTAVFAGGDFGVFYTSDSGELWQNGNADSVLGTIISITTLGSYIFASGGGSVWRRPLSEMISTSAVSIPVRESPSLSVYPNPATGSITITGVSEIVTIWDPMGRSHSVPRTGNTFDVSSLSAGVYFVSDGVHRTKFLKQ